VVEEMAKVEGAEVEGAEIGARDATFIWAVTALNNGRRCP